METDLDLVKPGKSPFFAWGDVITAKTERNGHSNPKANEKRIQQDILFACLNSKARTHSGDSLFISLSLFLFTNGVNSAVKQHFLHAIFKSFLNTFNYKIL